MKLKGTIHNLILLLFIILPVVFTYYIFVNTVLAKNVLPNIRVNSRDVSFLSETDLKSKIEFEALNSLPERLEINFEGEKLSVGVKDLDIKVDTYELVNIGKGNDILKVISDGLALLRGIEVDVSYKLDSELLLSKLQVSVNSSDPSTRIENKLICNKNNFKLVIDSEKLEQDTIEAIRYNRQFNLNLASYISDPSEKLLYSGCRKYEKDKIAIRKHIINNISESEIEVDAIFGIQIQGDNIVWEVENPTHLSELLDSSKLKNDVEPYEGKYEVLSDSILLFENYVNGSILDKEASLASIDWWLNSDNLSRSPLVYIQTTPSVLSLGKPILDFTQELAVGKTRIELVRDGVVNLAVPYTMFGLDEINNIIIDAGEEFSYIGAIGPQPNGTTKSGRPIAPGICNSTTTIFRAVLEAGLPITDRSSHAYYVPSYEWGYDLNIVDAAYYTDPKVDFKFRNDTDYPILLKVEYSRDSDYQYNTVKILTSSYSQKREVELTNWKIWDKWSKTNFKGAFDRVVRVNGLELFRDNFYSHFL